ncbi:MAG: nucleotide exchange factor GrpE [Leptolyngbyaceae bacterium]|nr:nucleotide exchange factor GrpE [Leptolyngbyaceae bacterium]
MIEDEKQSDNTQSLNVDTPEDLEEMMSDTISAETNLREVPDANEQSSTDSSTASQTVLEEETAPAEENQAVIGKLEQTIELLKSQLEERTSQYMRIAADFDNFRKRTQKEKEDLEQQIKCSTIGEMLPVVDNFERARSQLKPQTEAEMSIHKSYQGVYKQLVECLKRVGVSQMRSEGKEFDPNLHEAVMREPTDQYEEGTVMEELVRGYILGEKVLRHALVKVAAAPEPGVSSEEADQDH